MERNLFLWTLGLALVMTTSAVQAQQDAGPARLAFEVDEFTSGQRDALARELAAGGEFRIAFACVPAGILVIERVNVALRGIDDAMVAELVGRHVPSGSVQVEPPSLTDLEAQCAAARNF